MLNALMKETVHFQLLDFPGSQMSALLGMKDLLDHANDQAAVLRPLMFHTEICLKPKGRPDVVMLPPALTLDPPRLPAGWRDTLIAQHKSGTILASVCSGAFLLAEAGLFDGRRITTHWRHTEAFQKNYPNVVIDTGRLLVDLGDIVTAGGVMAWTDLSLHLIEHFGGRKLMLDVARMFVLDPSEREQSYYASFTPNTNHSDQSIAEIQFILQDDPSTAHTVSSLATIASMSERSFLRRFKQATGMTPVVYLQHLRVEAARSRLELTRDSIERIGWDFGYSDTAAFRRVFKRIVGLTPSNYRRRFGPGT